MGSRCRVVVLLGHLGRCKRSGDWRDVSDVYLTKRPTQVIVETVGAGARSQSASAICAGGVSAVISSSDLDGLTFHPRWGYCHRSNRSLLLQAKNPIVVKACPSSDEGQK